LRNIDHAIFKGDSEAVTFIQLVADFSTPQQRVEYAQQEASKFLPELEKV
jgi:hypothetical protein